MRGRVWSAGLVLVLATSASATAQPRPVPADRPAQETTPPANARPSDPIGRETPRGAVLGFLEAARSGDERLASRYLDTPLSGRAAEELALQLFVVLDARLPPRLTPISDEPEGSRADPLAPDVEAIGTVASAAGDVTISLQRMTRADAGPLWYFSQPTLDAVPRLYAETLAEQGRMRLPRFVTTTTFAGLRVIDWIALLVGLPLFFVATATLDRLLVPVVRPLTRRAGVDATALRSVLPVPARLLLLAVAGRWLLSWLPLSLLARQFWSSAASVIATVAIVWLLILANGGVEREIRRRWARANVPAIASLVRVLRRVADGVLVFGGLLVVLWRFGINPTPALAGLGVGGIAVALAAQRTLENLIAGASLVFDQAVRVGDFLRMGAIEGTVEHIGLRSTRIRTLDRTILSVPNSQIANTSVETLSERDKFWFHPEIRLRHDTTPAQLSVVLDGIRRILGEHASVEPASIRVRFIRLGPFSLDVEAFAYVFARDWSHFLELQEALLFGVTETVEQAGTGLAVPFEALSLAAGQPGQRVPSSVTAGVG